jgi:phage gp46-like protein
METIYFHDIKLKQDENNIFDINFIDGDFEVDDTFDINIIMSLFVDSRADESEVGEPLRRRGFWGDIILYPQDDNITLGSKLWLIYGRNTEEQFNRAVDYSKKSLDWLIAKNYLKTINISGDRTITGIIININFIVEDNSISEFNFKLWENGIVEVIESL